MSRFHAEVTRSGAGWLVYVAELDETIAVGHSGEIASRVLDLILAETGTGDEIDLVVTAERDVIRARAAQLGFETVKSAPRTDVYQLPGKARSVSVRYDDHGAVVGLDASTQVAEFQVTRDGAMDALFYTAQYSDIRRRALRKDT